MALQSGTKLGAFELIAPLGAGGMGEVYRARDTRLKRDVAMKVLPDAFVGDRDRMARFQREAEVLASLSHPNIAGIYEVAESGTTRALVMELVEGPTLSGPIPLETAIQYGRQIAETLEYAHERGVIHRDLKPANIKITPEGTVKLLDFGLAKAAEDPGMPMSVSNSPTFTMGTTQSGMILGTAAYMSPEQARGVSVDKRADIWAFGVVLYGMLTGKPLFSGEMASDILVAIIKDEPDLTVLPRMLHRCGRRNGFILLDNAEQIRAPIYQPGSGSSH